MQVQTPVMKLVMRHLALSAWRICLGALGAGLAFVITTRMVMVPVEPVRLVANPTEYLERLDQATALELAGLFQAAESIYATVADDALAAGFVDLAADAHRGIARQRRALGDEAGAEIYRASAEALAPPDRRGSPSAQGRPGGAALAIEQSASGHRTAPIGSAESPPTAPES